MFAEVQLVSCRNVLIYFDRELQDRAIGLFRDALVQRGFLGLGTQESIDSRSRPAPSNPSREPSASIGRWMSMETIT